MYREFIAAGELDQRFAIYEKLALSTLEPFGGGWNPSEPHIKPHREQEWNDDVERIVGQFWRGLSGRPG